MAKRRWTPSLFGLSGKTALITSANSGIGGGMTRGLSEAGADIIIFQIPSDQSILGRKLAAETNCNDKRHGVANTPAANLVYVHSRIAQNPSVVIFCIATLKSVSRINSLHVFKETPGI